MRTARPARPVPRARAALTRAGVLLSVLACRAAADPGAGAGPNPLLGTWVLDSGPPEVCGTTLRFTTTTQEIDYPNAASNERHPATYNASPTVVYAMHNNAQPTKYDFAGPNAMRWTGPRSECRYHRAGTTAPRPAMAAANPVLGDWMLIEPAPKGCYARLRLAAGGVTGIDAQGEQWPMPGTAAVSARGATYTGSAGSQTYALAADGTLANGTPPCRYRRG